MEISTCESNTFDSCRENGFYKKEPVNVFGFELNIEENICTLSGKFYKQWLLAKLSRE